MKLGSAGEAFFVEKTERNEFISKRLRSSPPLITSQKENTTVEGQYNDDNESPSPNPVGTDIKIIAPDPKRYVTLLLTSFVLKLCQIPASAHTIGKLLAVSTPTIASPFQWCRASCPGRHSLPHTSTAGPTVHNAGQRGGRRIRWERLSR
jgi:hypothetical protein